MLIIIYVDMILRARFIMNGEVDNMNTHNRTEQLPRYASSASEGHAMRHAAMLF